MEAPEPDQLWLGESAEEFGYTREMLLIRARALDLAEGYALLLEVVMAWIEPPDLSYSAILELQNKALRKAEELAGRMEETA